MADHVTDIAVSTSAADELKYQSEYFTQINVDLNEGAVGPFELGKEIFLWFRKGGGSQPITKLQLTYKDAMAQGLSNTGYEKIDKDLNAGAGGDYVFLWFFRGSGEFDTPIVDLQVTASSEDDQDAQKFAAGWERLGCNLNRKAGGCDVYIWLKRAQQTYICDLTATDSYSSDEYFFKEGYIRVDENTNRGAGGGKSVFLWFRQTTASRMALSDLQVSTTDGETELYRLKGFNRVAQNLNEGTDNKVFLWYKRQDTGDPIKGILLLLQKEAVSAYQKAGVTVIEKDLNAGNKGKLEYICVNQ